MQVNPPPVLFVSCRKFVNSIFAQINEDSSTSLGLRHFISLLYSYSVVSLLLVSNFLLLVCNTVFQLALRNVQVFFHVLG